MLSALAISLLRLDSFSCLLTVISTLLVGRKLWQGWVVAALNSVIICVIGLRTAQFGFLPANIFCIALYAHNLRSWRRIRIRPANRIARQPTDAKARDLYSETAAGIANLNRPTLFRLTVP